MMNQICLVGRLAEDPKVIEDDKGIKRTEITLAVSRSFKNENGEYETEYISCKLTNEIIDKKLEKGTLIGIKGRLSGYKNKNSNNINMNIMVERITILSEKEKSNIER